MPRYRINYYNANDEKVDEVVEADNKYAAKAPFERCNSVIEVPGDTPLTNEDGDQSEVVDDGGAGETMTTQSEGVVVTGEPEQQTITPDDVGDVGDVLGVDTGGGV